MKKMVFTVLIILTVSFLYAQNNDTISNETKKLPIGMYFEITIPPIITQINNNAPWLFSGGITYMDFGFGITLFQDIQKRKLIMVL